MIDVRANLSRGHLPVIVPRVLTDLTSERVLVMEFVEGVSLKDGTALRAAGIDCEQLVLRVCDAWACQMLRDGIFNADAHAGNILAASDPEVGAVPILLDFGLTKRLRCGHHDWWRSKRVCTEAQPHLAASPLGCAYVPARRVAEPFAPSPAVCILRVAKAFAPSLIACRVPSLAAVTCRCMLL